jgi:hypothetical protein
VPSQNHFANWLFTSPCGMESVHQRVLMNGSVQAFRRALLPPSAGWSVKMEAARPSDRLISYRNTTGSHNPADDLSPRHRNLKRRIWRIVCFLLFCTHSSPVFIASRSAFIFSGCPNSKVLHEMLHPGPVLKPHAFQSWQLFLHLRHFHGWVA